MKAREDEIGDAIRTIRQAYVQMGMFAGALAGICGSPFCKHARQFLRLLMRMFAAFDAHRIRLLFDD